MDITPDFDDIDIGLLVKKKDTKSLIKILRWSQVKGRRKQAAHAIGDIIMRERYPDFSDKLDYAGKEQVVISQIVLELIRVLQNDNDEVRYAAIEALAATRDLSATEALVDVLKSDTEPQMIAAASRALSSLDSTENQVIDAMVALLSSESILVREAVSSSLSDILYGTDIVANSQGLAERLVESMANEVEE